MSAAKHTAVLAWCAGIFEGEGWTCVRTQVKKDRPNPRRQIMAGITNTDTKLLQVFVDLWGARIRPRNGTALSRKQVYEWRVEARMAETFLRDIQPFLVGEKTTAVRNVLVLRDELNARRQLREAA